MKLGIIGLSGCGKATIFEALTHNFTDTGHKDAPRVGVVQVPDDRLAHLSRMYNPKKTIHAQVNYFLAGRQIQKTDAGQAPDAWTEVRNCDALVHGVRNFKGYGLYAPTPEKDLIRLDQELILADLMVVEKRIERIELEKKRHRQIDDKELALLYQCRDNLENEIPLRQTEHLASAPLLKGFAFLSAKPMLILINNEDDDDRLPPLSDPALEKNCVIIKGKLEQELAQMSDEEAHDFLNEFNLSAYATDRVIAKSYEILGLISFFTVGDDEVRAWTARRQTPAEDAAGIIHSDFKKGFIRAEVVAYSDLMECGSYADARKNGLVRLEGRSYLVNDGDIITFRFNL
jgi:GTP-binding protein YchF